MPKSQARSLYFLRDKVAFKAAGADLECDGGAANLSLYPYQIRFPGAAFMVFRMADGVTGYSVFSAKIASP
jgi:hypothetical protein